MLLLLSFSSYLFLTLLLDSLLSLNFLLRHSGTSPSTMQCLSRPPPLLPVSSIFSASSSLSFLQFLLCVGESSSAFMWFFLLEFWSWPRSKDTAPPKHVVYTTTVYLLHIFDTHVWMANVHFNAFVKMQPSARSASET